MSNNQDYDTFLEVEELESLLEDLEEAGLTGDISRVDLDPDLRERLDDAQVNNIEDLRARITGLHSSLDSDDAES